MATPPSLPGNASTSDALTPPAVEPAAQDERASQPLTQGYGNDTGYSQQPASNTIDPNEPAPTRP